MKPVRIGIVDSGVNPLHPHVGNLAPGTGITPDGESSDTLDVLGHGTAVAGLLHWKAPDAELVPVRVFQRSLSTNVDVLIRAVEWCVDHDIQIVNMSLGTANRDHEPAMGRAVERALSAEMAIVSAAEAGGEPALPGALPGVIGVAADLSMHPPFEESLYGSRRLYGKNIFRASPYPRPIPGVPVERNLHGVSFAVAHVTAWIARLWPEIPAGADWEQVLLSAQGESRSA